MRRNHDQGPQYTSVPAEVVDQEQSGHDPEREVRDHPSGLDWGWWLGMAQILTPCRPTGHGTDFPK